MPPVNPKYVFSQKDFYDMGRCLVGFKDTNNHRVRTRRFKAHFGTEADYITITWALVAGSGYLDQLGPQSRNPEHILWAFMFANRYQTEEENAAVCKCDEKTFRKWAWFYVHGIIGLERRVIKWDNRFKGDKGDVCLVSVDGVDFNIQDPINFSKEWWSYKRNGPGLRYLILVCIATGDIVGYVGPYPPKANVDLSIFRHAFKRRLHPTEKVVGDKGFIDSKAVTPYDALGDHNRALRRAMSIIRSRQETANWRVKKWNAMSHFRHHRSKHHLLFRAILIVTQIEIENGSPLFQVKGYSHPAHLN